jgi:hypothetical protein
LECTKNGVIGNYADGLPYPAEVCGRFDDRDADTARVADRLWTDDHTDAGWDTWRYG